jgi:hypothetical protein
MCFVTLKEIVLTGGELTGLALFLASSSPSRDGPRHRFGETNLDCHR